MLTVIQMWLTRAAILTHMGLHKQAAEELDSFGLHVMTALLSYPMNCATGNFDKPELYFQFYPQTYPGRTGSMVPFSLRLLHAGQAACLLPPPRSQSCAELPALFEATTTALNRLFALLRVCRAVILNIRAGKSEVDCLCSVFARHHAMHRLVNRPRSVRMRRRPLRSCG